MIAYRDSSEATNGTASTTVAVGIPVSAQVNDLAVLAFAASETGLVHTLSAAGWTEHINADGGGSSTLTTIIWSKLLIAGDLGTTLTVTSNNTGELRRTLDIALYSGAEVGQAAQAFETAPSAFHTSPSVTTVSADAWIVHFIADRGSPASAAFNLPSNVTQRQFYAHSGGASVSSSLDDDDLVGAGTRGADVYQGTISTQNASMVTLSLEPLSNVLTANAGPNQTATAGDTVTLSGTATLGTGSYSYAWVQTAGSPTVTLSSSTAQNPTFTVPTVSSATTLTFQLTVDDGANTATDTVDVTIRVVAQWAANGSWVARTRRRANGTWQ